MAISETHFTPPSTAAIAKVVRLAATLLCLAGVAILVVALRFGTYEYFHGEGRVLAWVWEVLHAG
jgi:hypothetical protein